MVPSKTATMTAIARGVDGGGDVVKDEHLAATPNNNNNSGVVYVFVFAHPDDESMFFLPTIRALVETGKTVWFLCLTTGNYDGLGTIREKELEQAGKLLGASKVIVRNDDETTTTTTTAAAIVDHPRRRFDKESVARAISESLSTKNINNNNNHNKFVLITFDAMGVSGHVNHTDVFLGVSYLMEEQQKNHTARTTPTTISKIIGSNGKQQQQEQQHTDDNPLWIVEAWYLESERNILFKYVPLLSWVLLLVSCFSSKFRSTSWPALSNTETNTATTAATTTQTPTQIFRLHDPGLNWAAMATHRSQFVWYRRLFVVFSCYTYYNKLVRIQPNR